MKNSTKAGMSDVALMIVCGVIGFIIGMAIAC